jgi:hypothetical protein
MRLYLLYTQGGKDLLGAPPPVREGWVGGITT